MTAPTARPRRGTVGEALVRSSTTYWGNKFCDASKVTPLKPIWNKSKDLNKTTIIRIVTCADPDNPDDLAPFRSPTNPNDFGDWIRAYWFVDGMGTAEGSEVSYVPIADNPTNYGELRESLQGNPYMAIVEALKRAKKSESASRHFKSHWLGYLEGDSDGGAAVPKFKTTFFARCLVYRVGDKIFTPPMGYKDRLCLMSLKSAGYAIMDACRKPVSEDGDPLDFEIKGNPVGIGPGDGLFWHIYHEDFDPRKTSVAAPVPARRASLREAKALASQSANQQTGKMTQKSYNAHSTTVAQVGELEFDADLSAEADILLPKMIVPWEDFITVPTVDQQVDMIVRAFNNEPELLLACWGEENPEWVDRHDLRAKAARKRQLRSAQIAGVVGDETGPVGQDDLDGVGEPAESATAPATGAVSGMLGRPVRNAAKPSPRPVVDSSIPADVVASGLADPEAILDQLEGGVDPGDSDETAPWAAGDEAPESEPAPVVGPASSPATVAKAVENTPALVPVDAKTAMQDKVRAARARAAAVAGSK